MSIVNILARVDEIQSRIRSLGAEPVAASGSATAATGASAGAFATAVQDVIGAAELAGGSVSGEDVVAQAKKYLGVPYVFGGEDMSGMDCSGLVQRVLADLGIDAPRVVQDQADIGVEVGSLAEARPGDLLVTNGEKHIVIYAGDGKIIHAPSPGKNVELRNNYLTDADIQTIRRVVPSRAEIAAAAAPAVSAASMFAAAAAPVMGSVASTSAGARATSMFAAASPVALTGTAATTPAVTTPPTAASAAAAASAAILSAMRAVPSASGGAERGAADAAAAVAAASAALASPAGAESVAAAPQPAAAAPAARTPFAQQVTAPVLSLARAGEGEHTLTLTVSPENLGPVTVKAQITGASIVIELAAPTDIGREALRALLVDLRRDLAGIAASSSVVLAAGDTSATGNGNGQNQNPSGPAWAGGFGSASGSASSGQSGPWGSGAASRGDREAAADTPSPVPAPAPAVVGSGIDLFA